MRISVLQTVPGVGLGTFRRVRSQRTPRTSATTRRANLLFFFLAASVAAPSSESPQVGNCIDCIGEINGALNICKLQDQSCVSSFNEDEDHFIAPFEFDLPIADGIQRLVQIATGSDFRGRLVERHETSDGGVYLRIVFGEEGDTTSSSSAVTLSSPVDAEFVFPADDAITIIRASSRRVPSATSASVEFSFSRLVGVSRNEARRLVNALRVAIGWSPAPVIARFDPKFNSEKREWFEGIFDEFVEPPKGKRESTAWLES